MHSRRARVLLVFPSRTAKLKNNLSKREETNRRRVSPDARNHRLESYSKLPRRMETLRARGEGAARASESAPPVIGKRAGKTFLLFHFVTATRLPEPNPKALMQ